MVPGCLSIEQIDATYVIIFLTSCLASKSLQTLYLQYLTLLNSACLIQEFKLIGQYFDIERLYKAS